MDTYSAWKNGRPVLNRLPEVYQDNPIADWLTDHVDEVMQGLRYMIEVVAPRQVDPLLCEDTWLDLLSNLCGWYGLWDASWPESSKRVLLANSYTIIWPNYGTAQTLSFVLQTLGVTHVIQEGQSFIIGREAVGDEIGAVAWEYDIILPTSLFNTREYKLAVRINELFGPIHCRSRILFDDTFFEAKGFFVIGDNTLLSVGDSQTVLEL